MSRLALINIEQLVPVSGTAPKRGKLMMELNIITNGCVIIEDSIITYVGTMNDLSEDIVLNNNNGVTTKIIDCSGKTVLPGFIDSHTHFVFGGYREQEFKMRLAGESYMDILKAGGGIFSSVNMTRKAEFDELYHVGMNRLNHMLSMGVTTVEGKSGYGLDKDTELKQLKVMQELNKEHVVDIVSTFLGPHSVPSDYKGRGKEYIDFIINEVLPIVLEENLAEFADIFCEKGVFSVEESKYYLLKAKKLGLKCKIHADEIVSLGGSELAVQVGATSADHLLAVSDQGIKDLADSDTIATLLPATAFSLDEPFAKARKMIDSGCSVALASDFNPGSCPTHSIPLIISLSALKMHMTIEEIITALTINGACALNKQNEIGSLEIGKKGDMIILNKPSIDFMAYHLGMNLVEQVIKNGKIVWISK